MNYLFYLNFNFNYVMIFPALKKWYLTYVIITKKDITWIEFDYLINRPHLDIKQKEEMK